MRTSLALATLLSTSLVLAACTQPTPKSSEILQLDGSQKDSGTNLETLSLTTKESTPSGKETTMSGAEPQKTLADFETIAATSVTLKTTKGDITFDIYTDKVPLTAQNFLNLAKEGFYDGIVFHRVIADFMAQAGDPLTKEEGTQGSWGTGGPGYVIADEFDPSLKHDSAGVVSMANRGPNTGGSQFFITFEPTQWLDGKHAVFGKVTEGLEVLNQITQGDKILSVSYN